jgi:hypothetical protein
MGKCDYESFDSPCKRCQSRGIEGSCIKLSPSGAAPSIGHPANGDFLSILDYLYSPKLSDICPADSALVRWLSQAFKLVPEEPLLLNGLCALGAAHLRDQCSRSLAKVPKELQLEDYRRQIEQYQQQIDRNQQHFERHKRLAISWLDRKLKQGPEAYLVSDAFGTGLLLLGLVKYLDAVDELLGVARRFMSMFSYLLENSFGKSDFDLLSAFGPMVVDLTTTYYPA